MRLSVSSEPPFIVYPIDQIICLQVIFYSSGESPTGFMGNNKGKESSMISALGFQSKLLSSSGLILKDQSKQPDHMTTPLPSWLDIQYML